MNVASPKSLRICAAAEGSEPTSGWRERIQPNSSPDSRQPPPVPSAIDTPPIRAPTAGRSPCRPARPGRDRRSRFSGSPPARSRAASRRAATSAFAPTSVSTSPRLSSVPGSAGTRRSRAASRPRCRRRVPSPASPLAQLARSSRRARRCASARRRPARRAPARNAAPSHLLAETRARPRRAPRAARRPARDRPPRAPVCGSTGSVRAAALDLARWSGCSRTAASNAPIAQRPPPRRRETRGPPARARPARCPFAERIAAAELAPHALGFVAQIDAQQQRRELAREQHDGDKAEQIADAVRGDDIRLQAHRFRVGQAELRDRPPTPCRSPPIRSPRPPAVRPPCRDRDAARRPRSSSSTSTETISTTDSTP